ncbi:ribonuclease toxin HepT-like protein [Spirochaeta dissipatitropha]
MTIDDRIKNEIQSIQDEKRFIELIIKKNETFGIDELELRGAAFTLTAIYNGIEKLFLHLLNKKNVDLEASHDWHTTLIRKAEENNIINSGIKDDLLQYLSFRHFIRPAYSFEIN